MTSLRWELEPLPRRMRGLPVHRGYPVPWFVEWVQDGEGCPVGEGEPDFRIMSAGRRLQALDEGVCWVCGQQLGKFRSFVIGPMCAVNRTSAEPPAHRDCAEWSARNCPFLARPHARRRDVPDAASAPGIALKRNPGVAGVWTVKLGGYSVFRVEDGWLFNIGEPLSVTWWAEGRRAARAEIQASIDSGLPALRELAEQDGHRAVLQLERMVDQALEHIA